MGKIIEEDQIKITHILEDGTVLKSIQDRVVPKGHPIYDYLAELNLKYHKKLRLNLENSSERGSA